MASVNPDPCPVYTKISENWQSFILYIALFKEYKNINFVIKRNMVESNEVTLMELYQKWSWSFDETNYFSRLPENVCAFNFSSISTFQTCSQFVFNFNFHTFSQFFLLFALTDAFTGNVKPERHNFG